MSLVRTPQSLSLVRSPSYVSFFPPSPSRCSVGRVLVQVQSPQMIRLSVRPLYHLAFGFRLGMARVFELDYEVGRSWSLAPSGRSPSASPISPYLDLMMFLLSPHRSSLFSFLRRSEQAGSTCTYPFCSVPFYVFPDFFHFIHDRLDPHPIPLSHRAVVDYRFLSRYR